MFLLLYFFWYILEEKIVDIYNNFILGFTKF